MKRKVCILVFLLSGVLFAFGQNHNGESWGEVKTRGSGTLACIYNESPGLVYNENGVVKGVCADILKDFTQYVREKHSVTLKVEFVRQEQVFTKFLKDVKETPNLLGVTNASITASRRKVMDFTPPYISNPMVLLTNKSAPTLAALEELPQKFDGYTALVIDGSSHVKYLEDMKKKYYPGLSIEYVPNAETIMDRVLKSDKSFTIIDFTEYFGAIKKGQPIKRHNVDFGESTEELGFIMKKGSDWIEVWNAFLTPEYRNSVGYKRIVANHLGSSFLTLIK